MITCTGERLSPYNIDDCLMRSELYREIRKAQTDSAIREDGNWAYYEVQEGDATTPELIAYKVYLFDALKWVVCIAAELDDTRERLPVGKKIYLPKTAWLRERIKHYATMAENSMAKE